MTEDANKSDSREQTDVHSVFSPAPDDLRLANLRQHLGYIIVNVAVAVILALTIAAFAFSETLVQTYNIPLYAPPMALLLEIGLLLILAYAQQTYSKRFRLAILISGIITIFEAGILFYFANPNL